MKHKHCGVIKAWAEGAIVQYKDKDGTWGDCLGHPAFYDNVEYRASLAFVEGKPVFEGDVLYVGSMKATVRYSDRSTEYLKVVRMCGSEYHISNFSWTPSKPSTVTVELLREDVEYFSNFLFLSIPFKRMQNAFKEALK